MGEFDYDQLDPGIRCVVYMLHRLNWVTSDSGDGVSKGDEEGVLDFPHVAITHFEGPEGPSSLHGATRYHADDLLKALKVHGIIVTEQGKPGPSIQYTYDPTTHRGLMMLMDLRDEDLPESLHDQIQQRLLERHRK